VAFVKTDRFTPGQEVEISLYLTQGEAYAAHYERKRIPFPDPDDLKQPPVLHVELSATELDATQPVTVVTRVAEVWPSVLLPDKKSMAIYGGGDGESRVQGLKAVWKYPDAEGKVPGNPGSPPPTQG
jgi:hypothetical protein